MDGGRSRGASPGRCAPVAPHRGHLVRAARQSVHTTAVQCVPVRCASIEGTGIPGADTANRRYSPNALTGAQRDSSQGRAGAVGSRPGRPAVRWERRTELHIAFVTVAALPAGDASRRPTHEPGSCTLGLRTSRPLPGPPSAARARVVTDLSPGECSRLSVRTGGNDLEGRAGAAQSEKRRTLPVHRAARPLAEGWPSTPWQPEARPVPRSAVSGLTRMTTSTRSPSQTGGGHQRLHAATRPASADPVALAGGGNSTGQAALFLRTTRPRPSSPSPVSACSRFAWRAAAVFGRRSVRR